MNKLFKDFEKVSLQNWKKEIIKDLKNNNQILTSKTENISIDGIYNESSIQEDFIANMPSKYRGLCRLNL